MPRQPKTQFIIIRYSIKLELQRLLTIRKRVKWYKKMGYARVINLPRAIGNLSNLKKFSKEKIKKILEKEYNESEYRHASTKIKRNKKRIESFFGKLKNPALNWNPVI